MNKSCNLPIWFLLIGMFTASALVTAQTPQTFQRAVVVNAQKYEPDRSHYNKPTDAPTPTTEYDYNVSIRLNCVVYVVRYESAIDYLSGAFTPDKPIEVSLEKRQMLVRVPSTGEIRMRIVRRYAASGNPCEAGH